MGKHMGSETHVSAAQTQALHLPAVAWGKIDSPMCFTAWDYTGCLSHDKPPTKP